MERIKFYDILKGLAIWIVAFEHSLLAMDPIAHDSTLSNAIQLIQMPLFIAISGYFFYPSIAKNTFMGNLKKKFKHLYLPSLCWGIIGACMMLAFKIITHKEIDVSYFVYLVFTGMWFLTALFLLSVIGAILYEYLRKYFYTAWFFVFTILYFIPSAWMINEIKFLLPFFVMAIFCSKWNWQSVPVWLFVLSFILFFVAVNIYDWSFTLYSMGDMHILTWEFLYKTIVRLIGGISGIVCMLYLNKYIVRIKYLNASLLYIGGVTLPIYVLHQKFLMSSTILNYHTNNLFIICMVSVIIILLSILSYKILRHKFFRKYLFGETGK